MYFPMDLNIIYDWSVSLSISFVLNQLPYDVFDFNQNLFFLSRLTSNLPCVCKQYF